MKENNFLQLQNAVSELDSSESSSQLSGTSSDTLMSCDSDEATESSQNEKNVLPFEQAEVGGQVFYLVRGQNHLKIVMMDVKQTLMTMRMMMMKKLSYQKAMFPLLLQMPSCSYSKKFLVGDLSQVQIHRKG